MPSITLSSSDLKDILTFTTALARQAGDLILKGSEAILSSGNVDEKKNSVDLVTEYDVRVEELVKGELSKQYPGFQLCVHSIRGAMLWLGSRTYLRRNLCIAARVCCRYVSDHTQLTCAFIFVETF